MGNIADALEKAGVDLVEKKFDVKKASEPGASVEKVARTTTPKEQIDTQEEVISDSMEQPQQPSLEPLDERVNLVVEKSGHVSESFRLLRSKILYPQDGSASPRTILIASSASEEGKSFVSINLAIAIASGVDQHALLVDCDLRRPSLAKLLGMQDICSRGLSEYLQGEYDLSELIQRTTFSKLSLLGSGSVPHNPAELLSSERMERLVEELSGRYSDRFIIFDSPPFLVASEAIVLTKQVDGVVIIVGSGKSDRSKIKDMVEIIGREKVIGVVFNGHQEGYFTQKMLDPYSRYGSYYEQEE